MVFDEKIKDAKRNLLPPVPQMRGLPPALASRLRLPLIAAPMLHVSGVDLVSAACRNGVIGAFPTANARSVDELDQWLLRIKASLADCEVPPAPWWATCRALTR